MSRLFDQLVTYPPAFIFSFFIFILFEAEKFLLSGQSFIIHYPVSKHNGKFRNENLTGGASLESLKR